MIYVCVVTGAVSPHPEGLEYMDPRRSRYDYSYISAQLQQCGFTRKLQHYFNPLTFENNNQSFNFKRLNFHWVLLFGTESTLLGDCTVAYQSL